MLRPARTPVHAVRFALRVGELASAALCLLAMLFAFGCGGGARPQFAGPTLTSFSAAKAVITQGDSTTLTVVFSAGQATIDEGVGPVQSGVPAKVAPTETTAYTVTLSVNVGGQEVSTVSQPVTVKVVPEVDTPEIIVPVPPEANHAGYTASVAPQTPGSAYPAGDTFLWTIPNKSGGKLTDGADTPEVTFLTLYGLMELECTVTNEAGDSKTSAITTFRLGGPTVFGFTGSPGADSTGKNLVVTDGTEVDLHYDIDGGLGEIDRIDTSGNKTVVATGFKPGVDDYPTAPPPSTVTTYTMTVTSTLPPIASSSDFLTVSSVPAPDIESFTTARSPLILGTSSQAEFLATFRNQSGELAGISAEGFQPIPILSGGSAFSPALGETTAFTLTVTNLAQDTETSQPLWVLVGDLASFAGAFSGEGSADDGPGTPGRYVLPVGAVADSSGNLFVSDTASHTIRKVTFNPNTLSWSVTTWAGTEGLPGLVNGVGKAARFNRPAGLAMDNQENLYVADAGNNALRRIDVSGNVTTFTGNSANPWDGGNPSPGPGTALFNLPTGAAFGVGSVFVSNTGTAQLLQIDPLSGLSRVLAVTSLTAPTGMVYEAPITGSLWVADPGANQVVQVTIAGQGAVVQVIGDPGGAAGSSDSAGPGTGPAGATFNQPQGLAVDGHGNLLVADAGNSTVRNITLAGFTVSTPFGAAGQAGAVNGTGNFARFDHPRGLAFDPAGDLFVADSGNACLREVPALPGNAVTSISGQSGLRGSADGAGIAARMNRPRGAALDALDNLIVADSGNHLVRQVTPEGTVTIWAGTAGQAGSADGPATGGARFNAPAGVAVDREGIIYVADTLNHTIRKIVTDPETQARTVATVAGVPGQPGFADSTGAGPGGALFNRPSGVATDSAGDVLVADTGNHAIRRIDAQTGTVTTVAGTGLPGSSDAPPPPGGGQFTLPGGLAVDSQGDIFVADTGNHTVRRIDGTSGKVTTVAGQAGVGGSRDANGTSALLDSPSSVSLDKDGNLFVANNGSSTVCVINTHADVTTFMGSSTLSGIPADPGQFFSAPLPTTICPPYGLVVDSDSGQPFTRFIYLTVDDAVLQVDFVPSPAGP